MRCMLPFVVGFAWLALTSFVGAAPLHAGVPAASYHFVDFRARSTGYVGHTYVVYGTIDDRGRIVTARAAGFYPRGALSESVFSTVLPMPSFVGLERSDRSDPPSAVFRLRLGASSYRRLVTTVERLRRRQPPWHLFFFNCNAFTASVARSIGLRVPSTLELPTDFISGLHSINHLPPVKFDRGDDRPE